MENNTNDIPQKSVEQNGTGPMIGLIIVILVFVIGGFYFWESKIIKERRLSEAENQAMSSSSHTNSDDNIGMNKSDIQNKKSEKSDKKIQNP